MSGGDTVDAVATTCPVCGTPVSAQDAFCGGCGNSRTASWGTSKAVSTRACPACGAALDDLDTFCGTCGSAAPRSRAVSATAARADAVPAAAPASATVQRSAVPEGTRVHEPRTGSTGTVRSSKHATVVVAVASAAAVVAVTVVVLALLAGRPTTQDDAATTTTTTVAPSSVSPPSTLQPPTVVTDTAPPLGGSGGSTKGTPGPGSASGPGSGSGYGSGSGSGAGGGTFWSVIVDSKRDRSEADAIARRLGTMGESAEVDWSSNYASLNPGYWVVHVGTYSDEYAAYRAQQQLQATLGSAGFADVYRRCFGDMPPCQDNNPRISG